MNEITTKLIILSECEATGKKIATFVLKVPKFIQPHINSHRSLSRNAASSRAVPAKKMRARVLLTPFVPVYFGENKAGMALMTCRLCFSKERQVSTIQTNSISIIEAWSAALCVAEYIRPI